MAGALDTIGKSRADLQEEERKRQEEERRQQEMAALEQQRTTFESVDPEGLSRSAMRKYDDASYMRSLNAAGELNRSGQRRLERIENRVIRDYDRGVAREQRKQDRAFEKQTNAKVVPTEPTSFVPTSFVEPAVRPATETTATQTQPDSYVLKDVYRNLTNPFKTARSYFGLPEDEEDFDPFN
jgi:hypothetical protein